MQDPGLPQIISNKKEGSLSQMVHKVSVTSSGLDWKKWSEFYDSVIKPLIQAGAEVRIQIQVSGESGQGIPSRTVELIIKESLSQNGIDANVDTE
jgi:hypothetical protein